MNYYKRVKDGITTGVESYSHNSEVKGVIKIEEKEFNEYIASLPEPIVVPVRDLAKEIDALKLELTTLKSR